MTNEGKQPVKLQMLIVGLKFGQSPCTQRVRSFVNGQWIVILNKREESDTSLRLATTIYYSNWTSFNVYL